MNILFWVRKNYVNREGYSQIICTITIEGKKLDIGTKLYVKPNEFNQKKQKAKGSEADYINDTLAKIKARLIEIKRNLEAKEIKITSQVIKETYLNKNHLLLENKPQENISILEALNAVQVIRKNILRPANIVRDKSFFKIFIEFLHKKQLHKKKAHEITKSHIIAFLDNLKEKSVSNNTRNSYLRWIKSIFAIMQKREMILQNPSENIEKLKGEQTRTVAIEPEHLKQIMQLCRERDTELYLFCLFVFYTFVRPIELRRLKVSNVNLEANKMAIYGNQSKNKKTEYVMIPEPLKKALLEAKFLERNPDEPLFSDNRDLQYSRNKYSTMFAEIIKENGFPKEYTLYCLKHTGVVEYYKKGCGIKFIKEQCRHSNLAMTDKYLKSLGLFENEEVLKNAPEI